MGAAEPQKNQTSQQEYYYYYYATLTAQLITLAVHFLCLNPKVGLFVNPTPAQRRLLDAHRPQDNVVKSHRDKITN